MNNRLPTPRDIERHLQLWIYLLPVVGIVPAIWTLYRLPKKQVNSDECREQKRISLMSVRLVLVWLISYASLFFGAANSSEIISFRLLYANAIITTAYFVTCMVLMSRLSARNKYQTNTNHRTNRF